MGQLRGVTDSNGEVTRMLGGTEGPNPAQWTGALGLNLISFNSNSSINWLDPNSTVALDQNGNTFSYQMLAAFQLQVGDTNRRMTATEMLDLMVLHELFHSITKSGLHPGGQGGLNGDIWNKCFN
jgi:hypothetical protein